MRTITIRSGGCAPQVSLAAGESAQLLLLLFDPATGQPYDLTNQTVLVTVRSRCCGSGGQPDPNDPSLIARNATVQSPATAGRGLLSIVVADTDGQPGQYEADVWITDTGTQARTQIIPPFQFNVTVPVGLPSTTPTPAPPTPPYPTVQINSYATDEIPDPTTQPLDALIRDADQNVLLINTGTTWEPASGAPNGNGARLRLYVRMSGSDTTGNGTLSKPYATPDHALDQAAPLLNWTRVVIDITGMTWRPEASNYNVFPGKVQARTQPWFNYPGGFDNPDFATFSDEADITFQAVPTQFDTIPAGYTNSHDTATGLVTLTSPGKNWTPGALVNKFCMGEFNFAECGCIVANDADSITIAANHTSFVSDTLGIYDLSATWQPADDSPFYLTLNGSASVQFNGIMLRCGAQNGWSVIVGALPYARFVGCDLAGALLMPGSGFPIVNPQVFSGCRITAMVPGVFDGESGIDLSGGDMIFSQCYFDSIAFTRLFGTTGQRVNIDNVYAHGCAPLLHSDQGQEVQDAPPINYDPVIFALEGVWIDSPVSNAIQVFGGVVHLGAIHITNCPGDGIFVDGPSKVVFTYRAASSGIVGHGIRVLNGGRVIMDSPVAGAIDGTAGGMKIGNRPARAWADFTANPPQFIEIDYNDLSCLSYDSSVQALHAGAAVMEYITGTPASWATSSPTTIAEALDRIAAAVALLRGTPIP